MQYLRWCSAIERATRRSRRPAARWCDGYASRGQWGQRSTEPLRCLAWRHGFDHMAAWADASSGRRPPTRTDEGGSASVTDSEARMAGIL
jgi:hypothetical protein